MIIVEQGSQIGHKADPVQVSRHMNLEKDVDGKLVFKPDEWRTPQQICQLFSRLAAGRSKSTKTMLLQRRQLTLATLRNEVMEQVALTQHPIVGGTRNICQFVHEKKLGSLKIVELQSICDQLDTKPSGSLLRKKSFITSIEAYVKTCQCFRE